MKGICLLAVDYFPKLTPANGPEKQVLGRLTGPGQDFLVMSWPQHDTAGPTSPIHPPAVEDTPTPPHGSGHG